MMRGDKHHYCGLTLMIVRRKFLLEFIEAPRLVRCAVPHQLQAMLMETYVSIIAITIATIVIKIIKWMSPMVTHHR